MAPPLTRIALDATPLLDVKTGVGTFTVEVLRRLAARAEFSVVAYGLTRIYLGELKQRLPAGAGATRRPIPQRTSLRLWRLVDHPSIERWTGPIDVVHGTNFVVPPASRAAELVTVHDLTPLRYPELCDDYTVHYPAYIRRAVQRGAHIHTISHFVADEVREAFLVPPDRVHVVPSGVTPAVGGNGTDGRALAGFTRYILSIGTVEPRKNHALLVRAFDEVARHDSDVGLVIAGKPGWRMEGVEDAIRSSPYGNRIRRLGWVSDKQRADLLSAASVLCFPSIYEGFGLPPLEAMSAGVPVVATRAGALPEVLGDAALLVEADRDDLAGALTLVLEDPAICTSLRERGRVRAAMYSWDRCTAELGLVYEGISSAVVHPKRASIPPRRTSRLPPRDSDTGGTVLGTPGMRKERPVGLTG